MNVIQLHQHRFDDDVPLVAFIDLQERSLGKEGSECLPRALANTATLLTFARRLRLPIAHFCFRSRSRIACSAGGAKWISGFEPRTNEHVFERDRPSCLSNEAFQRMLGSICEPNIVFAGICAHGGCLATAVDIHDRGYRGTFVKDCSTSIILGELGSRASLEAVYQVIGHYARVTTLDAVLQSTYDDGRLSWRR